MEKLVLLLAAMTFSWLGVEAQAVASADSVAVDSLDALTERFVNLGEVTVTGASVINKRDRKWIIPSQECKQAASNGSDLVRKMKLPGVKVGVIDGAISMYNRGTIKLYINGRPANDKDVQAIDPKSVERVEYHDVPSLRYGDADLVLDFIVKVPNSGGRVGGMGQVVPFKGLETQFRKNIEVNYKKSTFRVHFYDELLTGFKTWRDNWENYTLADGTTYTRTETGSQMPIKKNNCFGTAEYMYYTSDKDMLSIKCEFSGQRDAHTDYEGVLKSTLDGSSVKLKDHNYSSEWFPTIDMYYHHNFGKDKLLLVNVSTGSGETHSRRSYVERDGETDAALIDIFNDIRTRSNSLYSQVVYEQSMRGGRLSLGGSFDYYSSKNRYLSYGVDERMRRSSTRIYAKWGQQIGSRIDATVGLKAINRYYSVVGSDKTSSWIISPRVTARYRIDDKNVLRLEYGNSGETPTLSQLSSVRQQIDGIQQQEGNASLSTSRSHYVSLSHEYTYKRFFGKALMRYDYIRKPISERKLWKDGSLVTTFANQKNAQTLMVATTVRYEVIPEWLSASASLDWNRYIWHGVDYNHTLSNVSGNASLEVTHWNFGFMAQFERAGSRLVGERVYEYGSSSMALILSYGYKNFHFVVACLNPFVSDYKETTRDLNVLAGYHRASHYSFLTKCMVFQVHYNFSWGRNYQSGNRRVNNSVERNSVSSAGK